MAQSWLSLAQGPGTESNNPRGHPRLRDARRLRSDLIASNRSSSSAATTTVHVFSTTRNK
jgi:hypothetical protein